MKTLAVLIVLLAASPAVAEECDALASDIVRQEGATLNRRTSVKVILNLAPLSELSVDCGQTGFSAGWDGAFPPAAYFDLVARGSRIVTAAPLHVLRDGAVHCHKAALRDKGELATIEKGGITFDCQSFTREGGGTLIQVFRSKLPRR